MVQLALQLRPWSAARFDELIQVEECLIAALRGKAVVDGHDLGSGEANIFLRCTEPHATFNLCLPVIEHAGLLPFLAAGFREVRGSVYTRHWPKNDTSPFTVK